MKPEPSSTDGAGTIGKCINRGRDVPIEIQRETWAKRQKERRKTLPSGYMKQFIVNYRIRHPEKFAAGKAIRQAVRRGQIIKPDHCENCGLICNPEGHHHDYSKKLEVIWLCRGCHCREHKKELRLK